MYSSGLKASKLVCSKDWNVNGITDPIKNPEGNNSSLMSYSFCFVFYLCVFTNLRLYLCFPPIISWKYLVTYLIMSQIFGTHMKLDEAYG